MIDPAGTSVGWDEPEQWRVPREGRLGQPDATVGSDRCRAIAGSWSHDNGGRAGTLGPAPVASSGQWYDAALNVLYLPSAGRCRTDGRVREVQRARGGYRPPISGAATRAISGAAAGNAARRRGAGGAKPKLSEVEADALDAAVLEAKSEGDNVQLVATLALSTVLVSRVAA